MKNKSREKRLLYAVYGLLFFAVFEAKATYCEINPNVTEKNKTLDRKAAYNLSCVLYNATTTRNVSWSMKTQGGKWKSINSSTNTLKLVNVKPKHDTGTYFCKLNSGVNCSFEIEVKKHRPGQNPTFGPQTQAPVKSPKKPLAMKNDYWVQEDQNLTLQCWTKNSSQADYRPEWKFYPHCKHREVNIYNGTNYNYYTNWNKESSAVNFSLHLFNINKAMIGCYECCMNVTDLTINVLLEGHARSACTRIRVLKHNVTGIGQNTFASMTNMVASGPVIGIVLMSVAFYLLLKTRLSRRHKHDQDNIPFDEYNTKFDVFVSYSSHDYDWVESKLLTLLENHGVTYCIHSRDFEVGKPVVTNMIDSVYQSKHIVAVLSENYMSSSFCLEELSIASFKSDKEKQSSLVAIRIDNLCRSRIPRNLRNKTFLDYSEKEERKTWEKRLIRHLTLNSMKQTALSATCEPNEILSNMNNYYGTVI